MTTVDAPTVEQQEAEDAVARVLADFDVPAEHVAAVAGLAVLTRPRIAAQLADGRDTPALRRTVDALRMRHRPVPIRAGHTHLVCAATRQEFPCPDCALLYEVEG